MSDVDVNAPDLDSVVAALVEKEIEKRTPKSPPYRRCWGCWGWSNQLSEARTCPKCGNQGTPYSPSYLAARRVGLPGTTFYYGLEIPLAKALGVSVEDLWNEDLVTEEAICAAYDGLVDKPVKRPLNKSEKAQAAVIQEERQKADRLRAMKSQLNALLIGQEKTAQQISNLQEKIADLEDVKA